jgi:hypothetical protein
VIPLYQQLVLVSAAHYAHALAVVAGRPAAVEIIAAVAVEIIAAVEIIVVVAVEVSTVVAVEVIVVETIALVVEQDAREGQAKEVATKAVATLLVTEE